MAEARFIYSGPAVTKQNAEDEKEEESRRRYQRGQTKQNKMLRLGQVRYFLLLNIWAFWWFKKGFGPL